MMAKCDRLQVDTVLLSHSLALPRVYRCDTSKFSRRFKEQERQAKTAIDEGRSLI